MRGLYPPAGCIAADAPGSGTCPCDQAGDNGRLRATTRIASAALACTAAPALDGPAARLKSRSVALNRA